MRYRMSKRGASATVVPLRSRSAQFIIMVVLVGCSQPEPAPIPAAGSAPAVPAAPAAAIPPPAVPAPGAQPTPVPGMPAPGVQLTAVPGVPSPEVQPTTAPAGTAELMPVSLVDTIAYDPHEIGKAVAYLDDDKKGMSVKDWIAARVKRAKQGAPELVRIPVAHQCAGWGCECPTHYIGTDASSEGAAWLELTTGPHARIPADPGRDGFVRVADGVFTGKTSKEKWEADGEVHATYKLYGFHVLRSRPYKEGKDDALRLLLGGEENRRAVPALGDDRPWLAIAASIPYGTPKSSEKVQRLIDRLKEKGFGEAAYLDSRSAPLLFCCFHIVTAGRFRTSKEAQTAQKQLKSAGFKDAYFRRGW